MTQNHPLYAFKMEEEPVVRRIEQACRAIQSRHYLSEEERQLMSVLLHSLRRLPMITQGVGITLTLVSTYSKGNKGWHSLRLADESVELSVGEVIDTGVGGDVESRTLAEIGVGWRSAEADFIDLEDWSIEFLRLGGDPAVKVDLEDFGQCPIDLCDQDAVAGRWDQLGSEYV